MRRVAGLLLVLACSHPAAPSHTVATSAPAPVASAAPIAPPPRDAPHGGLIQQVALTDVGDAALTADTLGELRLWPTLDGSHPPVIVVGPAPQQLALGRDGSELYAAILDDADNVELARFDAAGRPLGRVQLPSGPAVEQVVAVAGGVLLRRADHSVEHYDPRGGGRGRLVAAHGQRIVAIAARRDRAIAGIAVDDPAADGRASTACWITMGPSLAWGDAIALPEPLDSLALAPGGHLLAGATRTQDVFVVRIPAASGAAAGAATDVVATMSFRRAPRVRLGRRAARRPTIGFVSDEQVVAGMDEDLRWALAGSPSWQVEHGVSRPDSVLVATDRAVFGTGASLVLASPTREQRLGYRWSAMNLLRATGGATFHRGYGVVVDVQQGRLWLDEQLEPSWPPDDPAFAELELMLDAHTALFRQPLSAIRSGSRFVLRSLGDGSDFELARISEQVTGVQYDPPTHVLAIQLPGTILRYQLSLSPPGAKILRPLADTGSHSPFTLTDPATAEGVVAVVLPNSNAARPQVYRLDHDGDGGPVMLDSERLFLGSYVVAVDRQATLYTVDRGGATTDIYPHGRAAPSHPASATATQLGLAAISHDGAWFASLHDGVVEVYDAAGATRWHGSAWRGNEAAWTEDDGGLIVSLAGGALVSFDAATGARRAMRCGWGFGLFDAAELAPPVGAASPCDAAVRHGEW